MFLAHIAIGSKSMLAANGDKKSFFPKGMQSDRILDRLGGNFFLEALFCKLSSLALSITLGPRNKGLDFANFISNVHSKQGLNETILRTCKIKFTHSYRKDTAFHRCSSRFQETVQCQKYPRRFDRDVQLV